MSLKVKISNVIDDLLFTSSKLNHDLLLVSSDKLSIVNADGGCLVSVVRSGSLIADLRLLEKLVFERLNDSKTELKVETWYVLGQSDGTSQVVKCNSKDEATDVLWDEFVGNGSVLSEQDFNLVRNFTA